MKVEGEDEGKAQGGCLVCIVHNILDEVITKLRAAALSTQPQSAQSGTFREPWESVATRYRELHEAKFNEHGELIEKLRKAVGPDRQPVPTAIMLRREAQDAGRSVEIGPITAGWLADILEAVQEIIGSEVTHGRG